MTNPQLYTKTDEGMRAGIAALTGHVATMRQAEQHVVAIRSDIQRVYRAASSGIFQQKMDEWVDKYQLVLRKFDELCQATQQADATMNQGEHDAHSVALSLAISDALR